MSETTGREHFDALLEGHRVVPVIRELFADGETPVGIYRKLAKGEPGSFLLESAEQGASGRATPSSGSQVLEYLPSRSMRPERMPRSGSTTGSRPSARSGPTARPDRSRRLRTFTNAGAHRTLPGIRPHRRPGRFYRLGGDPSDRAAASRATGRFRLSWPGVELRL